KIALKAKWVPVFAEEYGSTVVSCTSRSLLNFAPRDRYWSLSCSNGARSSKPIVTGLPSRRQRASNGSTANRTRRDRVFFARVQARMGCLRNGSDGLSGVTARAAGKGILDRPYRKAVEPGEPPYPLPETARGFRKSAHRIRVASPRRRG